MQYYQKKLSILNKIFFASMLIFILGGCFPQKINGKPDNPDPPAAEGLDLVNKNITNIDQASGIVLTFDDSFYDTNPNTWMRHFDLFDKYGAKAVFFVYGRSVTNFMHYAQNRGHEIGFHTITHQRLPELTREQFFRETTSPISNFRNAGIELISFAYPYGIYREWMNDELLNHYKILRGYTEIYTDDFRLYTKDEIKSGGFIDSVSIDNTYFRSETHFQNTIDRMLGRTKNEERIIVLTTHGINNARWGITPERLEYVLQKAQEYGLAFYRFTDF
jgi:peptidoglycan/xylan/chitin deacetylase (PgdA/CDA1 family)